MVQGEKIEMKKTEEEKIGTIKILATIYLIAVCFVCAIILGMVLNKTILSVMVFNIIVPFRTTVHQSNNYLEGCVIVAAVALGVGLLFGGILIPIIAIKHYIDILNIEKKEPTEKKGIFDKINNPYTIALSKLDDMLQVIIGSSSTLLAYMFSVSFTLGADIYHDIAWWIVFTIFFIGAVLPRINLKIVVGGKISLSFIINCLMDLIQYVCVAIFIVFIREHKEIDMYSSAWSGFFGKAAIHILRGLMLVLFIFITVAWIAGFGGWAEEESKIKKKKKVKRLLIFAILCALVDLLAYIIMPSAWTIVGGIFNWFLEVRTWWIPIICLLIAILMTFELPQGKDICADLKKWFKKLYPNSNPEEVISRMEEIAVVDDSTKQRKE